MLAATVVQILVMVGVPLALAALFVRRRALPGLAVLLGAGTFLGSQLVHLPLNLLLTWLGAEAGLNETLTREQAVVSNALVLGFTAAFCEEGARWIALRAALRRRPSWRGFRGALAHGLGHGGVESVVLGGLVVLTLWGMVMARNTAPRLLGTPDQAELVRQQVEAYWATPWPVPLLGAAERLMTMVGHAAFSVLVAFGVVSGQRRWVLLAFLWHWALDGLVVLLLGRGWSVTAIEGIVLVNALLSALALAWLARRPWPFRGAPPVRSS
ncbi:MAG: hypothetical protein CMN31_19700 [Sandaracinus sp.]|nr:hypothetical protein [Sandaracinus sp.]